MKTRSGNLEPLGLVFRCDHSQPKGLKWVKKEINLEKYEASKVQQVMRIRRRVSTKGLEEVRMKDE